MSIVRYDNPARTLDKLFYFDPLAEFARAFGQPATSTTTTPGPWTPAVDVAETEEAFTLYVELPGMKQEEIDIELTGDTLTLRGERKRLRDEQKDSFVRVERSFGHFQRSFTLATPVQNDKVSAAYRDGVLEITLPKSEETKPRKIAVTVEA
jgi:HSP20 family protein